MQPTKQAGGASLERFLEWDAARHGASIAEARSHFLVALAKHFYQTCCGRDSK